MYRNELLFSKFFLFAIAAVLIAVFFGFPVHAESSTCVANGNGSVTYTLHPVSIAGTDGDGYTCNDYQGYYDFYWCGTNQPNPAFDPATTNVQMGSAGYSSGSFTLTCPSSEYIPWAGDGCGGTYVSMPCSEVSPTPTPTPSTYCADYCGYTFQYPTAPGNLAIQCYFSLGGCTVCQDVLHLMSEAHDYWPCSESVPNVTPTKTPVPTYTYPTVVPTVTPTVTSSILPSITYAPVGVATLPTIAPFDAINTTYMKNYIYSKLGMNLTSVYMDWCDSLAGSVTQLFNIAFYIPDWPITTVTDLISSMNQILQTVISYFSSAVNVILYFATHAMNSLPDGVKWLMIYGCICDLAVLILRGDT